MSVGEGPSNSRALGAASVVRVEGLPVELTDRAFSQFRVLYAPEVRYAKIVFEFDKGPLFLLGDGYRGSENTFEYRQHALESPGEQQFTIGIRELKGNCCQPVRILVYDESGSLLAEPFQRVIRLRRSWCPELLHGLAGDVAKAAVFLWELVPQPVRKAPLTAKVAGALCLIALGYLSYRAGALPPRLDAAVTAALDGAGLESLRRTPLPLNELWGGNMFEHLASASSGPDRVVVQWQESGWNLSLSDSQFIFPVLPAHRSLYDFETSFLIDVQEKQAAMAWIAGCSSSPLSSLRAALGLGGSLGDYCLFRLVLPADGRHGRLETVVYVGGRQRGSLAVGSGGVDPNNLYQFVWPGDRVAVTLSASCRKFSVTMKLIQDPDVRRPDPERNVDRLVEFLDSRRSVRHGSFGFQGPLSVRLNSLVGRGIVKCDVVESHK